MAVKALSIGKNMKIPDYAMEMPDHAQQTLKLAITFHMAQRMRAVLDSLHEIPEGTLQITTTKEGTHIEGDVNDDIHKTLFMLALAFMEIATDDLMEELGIEVMVDQLSDYDPTKTGDLKTLFFGARG